MTQLSSFNRFFNVIRIFGLCITAIIFSSTFSGCAMVQTPALGWIYTDVQGPIAATSNNAGTRIGKSCASSILGLFASGDASINTARRNGRIREITSVDHESNSILGIYAKICTVVRGK